MNDWEGYEMASKTKARNDIRKLLRDFALRLLYRNFRDEDSLGEVNEFIENFMDHRYGNVEESSHRNEM
jgi:hypothetical protein